jgi:hypothetical protein
MHYWVATSNAPLLRVRLSGVVTPPFRRCTVPVGQVKHPYISVFQAVYESRWPEQPRRPLRVAQGERHVGFVVGLPFRPILHVDIPASTLPREEEEDISEG